MTKKKQRRVASKCKIPPGTPFQTLVRLDGSAPCPFNGAFNFTYKKESKACEQPHSRVVECMSDSQSLFKFEVYVPYSMPYMPYMPYNVTKDLVQQEAILFQWYMSNVHHSILSKMTSIYPKYILSYLI